MPVWKTVFSVQEDAPDADFSGEENCRGVLDAGHGGEDGGMVEQAG